MRPSLILAALAAILAVGAAEGTAGLTAAVALGLTAAVLAAPTAFAALRPRPGRPAATESLPDSYIESPIVSLTRR